MILREQNVVWLQVAVDELVLMKMVQGKTDLDRPVKQLRLPKLFPEFPGGLNCLTGPRQMNQSHGRGKVPGVYLPEASRIAER